MNEQAHMAQAADVEGRDALWNMFHKQGETISLQGQALAETRSEVRGLGSTLRDFMDSYKDGQAHVMNAIENMSRPKPNQLWQIMAICLVIIGMFGTVMLYTVSSAKEVGQLNSEHAREVADLKFQAATKALESAQQGGQAGFRQITEIIDQNQKEITRQWEKLAELHNKVEDNEMDSVRDNQMLLDLKEYTTLTGQEMNERLVRISDKLQDTNVSAGRNETALRATGDYLREHTQKEGAAGHPTPTTEVRVKEQPAGVTPP